MAASALISINPATTSPALAAVGPRGRLIPAMATDPITGNVVLYGGYDPATVNNGPLTDTWIWNGASWRQVHPPVSPSAGAGAAMAADPATGTILLFGGDQLGETWIWDGRTETWTKQTPVPSPGVIFSPRLATDKSTNTVVMFGGSTLAESRNDTWTWNGSAKTWTLRVPPIKPPARLSHMMATDPRTGTAVLFGGETVHHGGELLGDTWTWNGREGTWTRQTPPNSPPARQEAYMAYHAASKRVVLFGGMDDIFPGARNDTWTWDGVNRTWTQQTPTNRPCPRDQGAMAYHPGSRTAIIFGGDGESFCFNTTMPLVDDTWAWNGVNWKRKAEF